jgi:hypothetical protein
MNYNHNNRKGSSGDLQAQLNQEGQFKSSSQVREASPAPELTSP